MNLVELTALLALLQYLFFGLLTSRARSAANLQAPATVGDPHFERMYRVQTNTLELLIVYLPTLWLAAHHWNSWVVSAAGAVFIVGRHIYWRSYIKAPATRRTGFMLSLASIMALVGLALIGALGLSVS